MRLIYLTTLSLILILNGCVNTKTKRFKDININVVYSNLEILESCFKDSNTIRLDNGKIVSKNVARITGCYNPVKDEIYILYGPFRRMFCTLLHELAHREGVTDPRTDGYEPDELCRGI